LEVLERRTDGYHNLRSVMQSLDLHDTITIGIGASEQKNPLLQLTCDNPALPTDERNLVYRAAKYMMEACSIKQNISVHIEKRIPVAAGLGGGSSDCAAALVGMSGHFCRNQSVEELRTVGLKFGADVPFCITGGTMSAEGVGEILTELPPHPPCWIVLACPPVSVSTAAVFAKSDLINKNNPPNFIAMQNAIKTQDIKGIAASLGNMLTPITTRMHPEINGIINQMKKLGALNAAMSGSGPSVFGYFENKADAQAAYHKLKKTIANVYITRPERKRLI
jgi:4-diphosphocytidyl-2-C-methyl-D-erythritol kinase